mmetsp:Transcript_57029/g.134284  ORF Transcript_57029/g.134284 Transcript_57029/m.134284 type:complete len:382 (+) Transcript_57029:5958-7103(+)
MLIPCVVSHPVAGGAFDEPQFARLVGFPLGSQHVKVASSPKQVTVALRSIRADVARVPVRLDVVFGVDAPGSRATRASTARLASAALLDAVRKVARRRSFGRVHHHRASRAVPEHVKVLIIPAPLAEDPARGRAGKVIVVERAHPVVRHVADRSGRARRTEGVSAGRVHPVQRLEADALREVGRARIYRVRVLGTSDALRNRCGADGGAEVASEAVGAQLGADHVLEGPRGAQGALLALLQRALLATGALNALLRLLVEHAAASAPRAVTLRAVEQAVDVAIHHPLRAVDHRHHLVVAAAIEAGRAALADGGVRVDDVLALVLALLALLRVVEEQARRGLVQRGHPRVPRGAREHLEFPDQPGDVVCDLLPLSNNGRSIRA